MKCSVQNGNAGCRIMPSLLLCGDWLNRAGFCIDEKVLLTVYDSKLVIRKLGAEPNPNKMFLSARLEIFC